MNAIVIEHVPLAELPPDWRARLGEVSGARVTVTIEAESGTAEARGVAAFADDPLFGMWSDREDMADVAGYIRAIRAPRFGSSTGAKMAGGDSAPDTTPRGN